MLARDRAAGVSKKKNKQKNKQPPIPGAKAVARLAAIAQYDETLLELFQLYQWEYVSESHLQHMGYQKPNGVGKLSTHFAKRSKYFQVTIDHSQLILSLRPSHRSYGMFAFLFGVASICA